MNTDPDTEPANVLLSSDFLRLGGTVLREYPNVAQITQVAEPLGVGLDRIAVNLETVLVLENLFHTCERILRSMEQAEVNDRFGVVTTFVEPLRTIAIVEVAALRALLPLNLDGDLIEAILSE